MGIVYGLLSAVFAASKDLVSKKLAHQIDGMTSTYASFAFALPFYGALLAVLYLVEEHTFTLTAAFFLLVLLRSMTDVLAEGMKMYAFSHADISVVSCFFSLSPVLLLFTSPLITGDQLSPAGILGVLLVVGGSILVVYRPSHKGLGQQKKGVLLALAASFFFSLNSCFDRLAVLEGATDAVVAAAPAEKTVAEAETSLGVKPKPWFPAVFAGFAMTLLSAVFLVPMIFRRGDRQAAMRTYRKGLWLRGFLEVIFMSAKLMALQYFKTQEVVSMQRLSLVLSIIGGRVFFHEQDFSRRLAAGMLILCGVLMVLLW